MFRLRLFGGATIEGPNGPLSGRVAQRRQLALLAFLSLQGDRPTSRDKLVALFWPESDAERARHNLADSIYRIRRALGVESVRSLRDDVVLTTDRVRSDVADFEALLDAGELEAALELYAGPFLEGFHLSDSRGFEHWLDAERERLARLHLNALERLADAAETAGRPRAAVRWWREAAAAAPHDSRVALRFMRALVATGDRAGALRWARTHAERMEAEFGLDPDPALIALASELRKGDRRARDEADDGAPGGPVHRAAGEAVHGQPDGAAERIRARPESDPRSGGGGPPSRWRAARRWGPVVGFAAGVTLLILAASHFADDDAFAGAGAVHELDPAAVVVVPFRTGGASPELDYLGHGMVELLAAKFTGDGGLRAVDPGVVLAAWDRTGSGGDPSRAVAIELAREQGAGTVIMGGVVGTRDALSLRASVIDVRTGVPTAEGAVDGPESSLHALIDRLVAQVLARRAGEEEHRMAHLTTASLPALRAFLRARAAHRSGDYEAALREYGRALDLDSTFALAGLRLIQISGWVGGSRPLAQRGRAVVLRHLDRLSARDLAGFLGRVAVPEPGQVPSVRQRLAAVEEALRRWPRHPMLWHYRGDGLLHFGEALGLPSWERRARESFERAIQLDPDYAEPVHHLAVVLGNAGDTAALRRLVEEQLARRPIGPIADHLRWRAHHHLGDTSAFRLPPLDSLDTDATLRWIGIEAQDYGFAIDEGARAVRIRVARPGIRDEHFERRMGAFAYALNRGRPTEALALLESIREVQPDPHVHLRLAILGALYGDLDPGVAARAASSLADAPTGGPIGEINLCVRSQWRLAVVAAAQGSAAGVAPSAVELPPGPRESPSDVELPPMTPADSRSRIASYRVVCSAVARAQQAALLGGPGASAARQHLDSLLAMGRRYGLVDDGHYEFAHIALARLHRAAGNPEAALRAIRRRSRYNGWQPWLTTMLRDEARLAAALGDTAGAIRAYQHYLAFRTDPERALVAEVAAVRAELCARTPGLTIC